MRTLEIGNAIPLFFIVSLFFKLQIFIYIQIKEEMRGLFFMYTYQNLPTLRKS